VRARVTDQLELKDDSSHAPHSSGDSGEAGAKKSQVAPEPEGHGHPHTPHGMFSSFMVDRAKDHMVILGCVMQGRNSYGEELF
jgi:hypothetical protein